MQTTFLTIFQVDIPNPVCFFQFMDSPIVSPLKVSVVFLNHIELSLRFLLLRLPTAYQVLPFMEEKKMLKNVKDGGRIYSTVRNMNARFDAAFN